LKHVSLIDTEPYTALSYCWGDLSSDEFLRLDSEGAQVRSIAITENLHRALLAVWERRGEKQELRIWVDALCINQSDLYERIQQVQMMRQIYSRAEEVLAWVGPIAGTAPSPAIERSLRKMQMAIHQPTLSADQALSSISDSMLKSEDEWDAMISFFNKEYWRRVWIIQEITVASTVTMLYGAVEVSWDVLVPVLRSLVKRSAHRLGEQGIHMGGIGASHLLRFREHWIDTNKPISILQAMTWTTHTKATDPRDKIFALLGLCHDGFRIVPVPNYKQSLKSIISEMSRLSFSLYRSLDLICLRGPGTKSQDPAEIPTWAPNWPSLWSSPYITSLEKLIFQSPKSFDFDPVLTTSTTSVLRVKAIYVGSINRISSSLERHTQKLDGATKEHVRVRLLIWRTLTMDCLGVDIRADEIDECFTSLWTPQGRGSIYNTQIINWLDSNAWFKIGPWTIREWSQLQARVAENQGVWSSSFLRPMAGRVNAEITERRRIEAWDATNQALEHVLGSGMRLAEWNHVLEKRPKTVNFMIGLVNPHTRSSDGVFFLRGCSVPVVLRQIASDTYQVIGGVWLTDRYTGYLEQFREKFDVPYHAEVVVLDLV
ncbi:heterokaryon incompatibility protein-domain-containing protein, partial [Hyaloscypha finlandica]